MSDTFTDLDRKTITLGGLFTPSEVANSQRLARLYRDNTQYFHGLRLVRTELSMSDVYPGWVFVSWLCEYGGEA